MGLRRARDQATSDVTVELNRKIMALEMELAEREAKSPSCRSFRELKHLEFIASWFLYVMCNFRVMP